MVTTKSEEIKIRKMAERRGMRISKSRRRDRLAVDYGTWTVTDLVGGRELTRGLWPWVANFVELNGVEPINAGATKTVKVRTVKSAPIPDKVVRVRTVKKSK